MDRLLPSKIDLHSVPADTSALKGLNDSEVAAVFAEADRLVATSFLWACACVEEFRLRHMEQTGRAWADEAVKAFKRSRRTIFSYTKAWTTYQLALSDPILSPKFGNLLLLPKGTVHVISETPPERRLEALNTVIDWQDRGGDIKPSVIRGILRQAGFGRGRKQLFGPPLNFRELRHEPINEQGVVYLFARIANELGFLVEAIGQGFPDCQAKRKNERGYYEAINIEFEFKASNFKQHKHDAGRCQLLVCWENDWPVSPVEVLELKSAIRQLDAYH